MESKSYTIRDVREGLKKGHFSAEEILRHYENKIIKENKNLNAFLAPFKFVGDKLNISEEHLCGIPYALKDNIMVENALTTAGSKILENYRASFNASIVEKLSIAGANCLGKTNMDEFAMGTSTENSAFGPTKNPHDLERVPGGSSGGSAAAVAADLTVFALGSDTGGSIRQPAAFCGVVGFKPSYGRVSRHGLIAMASSLDQIGPITKNVEDAAIVFEIIAGFDKFDSTTLNQPVPEVSKTLSNNIKGLKVGVPKEFFGKGLSQEVREKVEESIKKLESLGCEIKEVSLPNFEYGLAAYYIVVPSEVSSNLARFDGIRYGYSDKESLSLLDVYFNSRSKGLGPEPKRRIILGTYALSSGYYDAYYLKAQKVRALLRQDFDKAFEKVDVIVGPVSPTTAFKIGEKISDPLSLYLEDIYTVPVNLAGLPGISVPCGLGSESKMPVGFQIIGKYLDEATVLLTAYHLEQSLK